MGPEGRWGGSRTQTEETSPTCHRASWTTKSAVAETNGHKESQGLDKAMLAQRGGGRKMNVKTSANNRRRNLEQPLPSIRCTQIKTKWVYCANRGGGCCWLQCTFVVRGGCRTLSWRLGWRVG